VRHIGLLASAVLVSVALSGVARADCAVLDPPQATRADALLASLYIHDCCDQTLAVCLEAQPVCVVADRVAANVCRRVAADQDDEQIARALAGRARTFLPGYPTAEIDLEGLPVAGDPDAPVTLVEFADARGVHCARMTPPLLDAVETGPLAGKVRLAVVLFPLRSNPHAKEAGLAVLAAAEMGVPWSYLRDVFEQFESFAVDQRRARAEALGLDGARFEELLADPALTERLVAGKRAGLELGVEGTPTFFIDGRRYEGEMEVDELVDVLEEAHDRAAGRIHRP
jgi:protein-disulfide isomerase